MTTNKLAIIGGSGLYDVEEFKERDLLKETYLIYKHPGANLLIRF